MVADQGPEPHAASSICLREVLAGLPARHSPQAGVPASFPQNRLSPEDYRGLTPLIYAHITPYGRYDIDLATRIEYERMAA